MIGPFKNKITKIPILKCKQNIVLLQIAFKRILWNDSHFASQSLFVFILSISIQDSLTEI